MAQQPASSLVSATASAAAASGDAGMYAVTVLMYDGLHHLLKHLIDLWFVLIPFSPSRSYSVCETVLGLG